MDLLDRYLQAVKKHLPWQRQDDIIAELRANLESQLEDKEAALGRPLTIGETEDWLREMGPPIQVAARYLPQQYLIGPRVFPMYWFVMRMAFFWAVIIYSIVNAVLIMVGQNPSGTAVLEAVLRVPVVLMTVATWVTLVFAAIEFAVTHYPEKCPAIAGISIPWSPGALPPLEKEHAPGKKPRSYGAAVAEVVFGFLFLVWLLLIPQNPALLLGPGAAYLLSLPYQLAPVWIQFFWLVVALNVLQLSWHAMELSRGTWQRPQPLFQLAFKAFGLIPLLLLYTVSDQVCVTLKNPALDQARYGATLQTINQGIHKALLVICVIVVLQFVWDIAQITLDAYRKRVTVR